MGQNSAYRGRAERNRQASREDPNCCSSELGNVQRQVTRPIGLTARRYTHSNMQEQATG